MQQSTFADLGVSEPVSAALRARGIERPFPVQQLVIGDVLDGHDVLVKSPTGSGKTLAFGIPLVDLIKPGSKAGRQPGAAGALVLAPTRELATQIADELTAIARPRRLSVAAVYGGTGFSAQIRAVRRADILVATPGRLGDLLDRRAVSLGEVEVLVLDEADRMLDMGFRPVVDKLVALTPADRQTLLFSATLEGEAGRVARAYTSRPRTHEHKHSAEAQGTVEHRFVRVKSEGRTEQLVRELKEPQRGRTLVFVRTKRGADRLTKQLVRHSIRCAAMHGDKSQGQRERALASFEDGRIDTLVATDVAARGIDVNDITHVINFDLPGAREDYVHRVGRTARAGASGVGITFVLDDQVRDAVVMSSGLGLDRELKEAGLPVAGTPSRHTAPPSARQPRSRRRGRGRSAAGRARVPARS